MGQRVSFGSDMQSQLALLLPRLKSFAAALTGDADATQTLVKATVRNVAVNAARERGHMPIATYAYGRMHTLWSRHEQARAARGEPAIAADPHIFEARGGVTRGMAELIAAMPAQQRATLALVYGDGVSYDEAAEIFGVSVATVMTRLVRGHAALAGERAGTGAGGVTPDFTLRAERREQAA